MNEQQWLTCADPDALLAFLHGQVSPRQLRLFACACCRRIWHLLTPPCRRAVEVVERRADGLATEAELGEALERAEIEEVGARGQARAAARAAASAWHTAEHARSAAAQAAPDGAAERRAQSDLLRDIVGNPFRTVPTRLDWLAWGDGCVPHLARAIYEEGRFGDLPVLADALEEAGCAEEPLLAHCRSPEPHLRGCWVLDALLGAPVAAEGGAAVTEVWTPSHAIEAEGRFVRQTSCPAHFAAIALRIEPHAGHAPVVFLNTADGPGDLRWVPCILEGVRQFLTGRVAEGIQVTGARVVLTRLLDHPVDSSSRAFEQAAQVALARVFVRPGGEP